MGEIAIGYWVMHGYLLLIIKLTLHLFLNCEIIHIIQVFRNQSSNQKQEVQVILLTSTKKVHQSVSPYKWGWCPQVSVPILLVDPQLNMVKTQSLWLADPCSAGCGLTCELFFWKNHPTESLWILLILHRAQLHSILPEIHGLCFKIH